MDCDQQRAEHRRPLVAAYHLAKAGHATPGMRKDWTERAARHPERSRVYGEGDAAVSIKQKDIPAIIDSELPALEFYFRYKIMGLPFSGGWAEQPALVIDIIETLEVLENTLQQQQAAKIGNR